MNLNLMEYIKYLSSQGTIDESPMAYKPMEEIKS
jgi:hypothetical protein